MHTYLRPTALARYLDLAPQRISQLVNRGVLDPPGPDGFDADLVRVRYIRHLRANLVTHATAGLTKSVQSSYEPSASASNSRLRATPRGMPRSRKWIASSRR